MYISVTCLAFRGAAREVHQLNFWDVLQSGTRLDYCHQAKGRLGFRLEACRTSQNHCTQRCKLATTAGSHEAAVWVMGRVLQPESTQAILPWGWQTHKIPLLWKHLRVCAWSKEKATMDDFLKRPCWLLLDILHWPLNTHTLSYFTQRHTHTHTNAHTHTHKHVHTFGNHLQTWPVPFVG